MSTILYYSTYCDNCNKLLQIISTSNSKKDMHFINIDKRVKYNQISKHETMEEFYYLRWHPIGLDYHHIITS